VLNHPNISPWPYYEADEIEAASQTLQTGKVNYWTGELGRQFETAYAQHVGKQYGVALANGTVALELALRVLGVKAGDEVIVASRSYVASASCVLLVGAIPVFADVDIKSGNISAQTIAPLITKKTKAVIPVHVGGLPCDMPAIVALANQYNMMVVEDCAQAHGAYMAGKPVGAWGHAAIFSFCQDKIISTGGEGGMLLLNDEAAYKKAWAYKDIGRSFDAVYHQQHSLGFRWLTESVGSNFRMTEFQAAIGLKQLGKLPNWITQRNHNAERIISTLKNFDFVEVHKLEKGLGNLNAYYRLYAKLKAGVSIAGLSGEDLRNAIISRLENVGVPCFVGSCSEIYREKLFADLSALSMLSLPNAANWASNGFCFLVHPTITAEQLTQIVINIERVMLDIQKK
jgi:dTDP-4-amino-4,6-dideoxygalactose transaminase